MMLGLMMVWISVPVQAQNVIEDEGIETVDEKDVSDSTLVDSLAADTLAQKLPWPESVKVGIDKLLESKMFETSQVGLMVWDLSADSCIYQKNERQLMRPASTMKLLTAITALDKLGGSYQFKTSLKYTGTIENGVLTGDVTIRGSIYADRSLKDADLLGEGWCWDDDNPVLSPLVFQRKDIFMDKFLAKLREEGIEYSCFGASEKTCPASAFTVCTRFHTMDQILHKMMKESDNLYAESMYYQIAASTGNKWASAKSARNVERQLIRKIGLDPARYKLADGSGLSLYNYLSAELEVKLLRYAYLNGNIMDHLKHSLPIGGVDGTLKQRMKKSFVHGNVKAKTGTLTGIISLAGYCTAANGHELCFAIINNGIMHGNNARHFADKVCTLLCQP